MLQVIAQEKADRYRDEEELDIFTFDAFVA